ncbi:LLM class flavin-dependent oxidoreductase [Agromyces badenianii]|uniref:LLM class flavin-dependent oxidoreductase n=1 Tax=Agromyces badenianii TaxID=2080742 RepID=A0A2S0WTD0_9MICO|nr:NtaA/DmoA family FMN-dependent monooxygenase [Agromyces badenianii]AWB94558.1 LLM class flavin-dependent oxidoreductase [Agromyces badenianii]PWC03653.1 LLM class flavin-dependent oxidoreductase [Agromyces badenianii]
MTRLIIGAMVRAIGAYPSGWRYPGAHRDPRRDAAVLRRTAQVAEAARLDYLFFGDWLATGHDLEFRDPYLVARIDPISAITYLSGITSRIGLIATANTSYADPYTLARSTASIDLLSGGRAGLNLVTGAEPRAAGNHGLDFHAANEARYDRAVEFEIVLRRLWDSFEDDAFVADAASGAYLDPQKLHATDFHGEHLSVTGPLNVARPVQGHLPIVHAGTSPRSRLFAAQSADLALVAVGGLEHAVGIREELRSLAFESGRDDRTLKVIAPVLPIVGETREHAQSIADELSELVQIAEDWPGGPPSAFPANRSIAQLSALVGVDLAELSPDRSVTTELVAQFNAPGQELVEIVAERTGRSPGGDRPPTLRHLVVAASVNASMVVGTADDIAAEFEAWGDAGAVDGFNVLSAVQPQQFEAFALQVVPELQRRGVFPTEYEGETLRDHLGLGRPGNVHVTPGDAALQGASPRDRAGRGAVETAPRHP